MTSHDLRFDIRLHIESKRQKMVTWQTDEMITRNVSVQNDGNVNQWLPKESNQKKLTVLYKKVLGDLA